MTTDDLLTLATAYATHTGRALATISNHAAGQGRLFDALGSGRGCTLRTYHRVIGWFDENWPQDLAWPAHVARPAKHQKRRAA